MKQALNNSVLFHHLSQKLPPIPDVNPLSQQGVPQLEGHKTIDTLSFHIASRRQRHKDMVLVVPRVSTELDSKTYQATSAENCRRCFPTHPCVYGHCRSATRCRQLSSPISGHSYWSPNQLGWTTSLNNSPDCLPGLHQHLVLKNWCSSVRNNGPRHTIRKQPLATKISVPGSKIPLILQDLRRNLTRTSCKSLQESSKTSYKTSAKTAYKILAKTSCQDSYKISQDLTRFLPRRLAKILTKILPRSYKILQD